MTGRTSGFRFSSRDAAVLIVTLIASAGLWPILGDTVLPLPIVIGHFFLFCNVFRVHRNIEYLWAALFVLNVLALSAWLGHSWWEVLAVQTPITLLLIGWEMRQPRYHGVWAHRINQRHLDRYLRGEV